MPIMRAVLHQYFVRADGAHAVVDAIAASGRLPLDVVQGGGMNHGARRPRRSGRSGNIGDELRRFAGVWAEPAKRFHSRGTIGNIVSRNYPRPCDWILA